MSARTEFANLLSEAELVVDLAVRHDKATPALLRSLRDAEKEFDETHTIDHNLDDLMSEMLAAELRLHPTALFVKRRLAFMGDFVPRIFFYTVAFIVTILTAVYTTHYISVKNNLSHLDSLQHENIMDVAFRFWMMSPNMKLPEVLLRDPPSYNEKALILEKLEQVAQLNDQLNVYIYEANQNIQSYKDDVILSIWPAAISNMLIGFDPNKYINAKHYPQLGQEADVAASARKSDGGTKSSSDGAQASSGGLAITASESAPGTATAAVTNSDSQTEAEFFESLDFHGIAQLLPANRDPQAVQPIEGLLNQEAQVMERYGQIVLPVLLGMLGAIVYHVRLMLNRPNMMGFWRVNLRVLLGGLAGVSGSVFVSAMATEQIGIFGTGMWLFLLAFLLGFSLELFFTVLDRLVRFAEDRLKPGDHDTHAVSAPTGAADPLATT